MRFNMKCLLAVFTMVFIGCANDTGVSADYDDNTTISSSSYEPYAGMYYSSSEIPNHYFPTDLEYVGIYKTSHGANLVMKNNTAYPMSIKVNYTISCSVDGKPAETTSKTQSFYLDMYEQEESSNSVDGYWHGGMTTIDCTGTITSIIPTSYNPSNFQAWTGSYPISTK